MTMSLTPDEVGIVASVAPWRSVTTMPLLPTPEANSRWLLVLSTTKPEKPARASGVPTGWETARPVRGSSAGVSATAPTARHDTVRRIEPDRRKTAPGRTRFAGTIAVGTPPGDL